MAKEIKYLYEVEVNKEVEEPVIETKEENGQKVETKTLVKKIKQVKLAIIKPNKRLQKDAEIFYASKLAYLLQQGLLPYTLVSKRYANDGGPYTQEENKKIEGIRQEIIKYQAEFFNLKNDTEDEKTKKRELLVKITNLNVQMNEIRNAYSDIFDNTAEMKARQETIEYWCLFLLCLDEDGKGYKPIFGDGDYKSRYDKLEEIEDAANPFYIDNIKRGSYLINFWFSAPDSIKKDDFDAVEKVYTQELSTYKPNVPVKT